MISDEVDDQLAGKAFWVIGNVAFLSDKVEGGPANTMSLPPPLFPLRETSTFGPNSTRRPQQCGCGEVADRGYPALHRACGVGDGRHRRQLERYLLLDCNRAHWSFLAGDPAAAVGVVGRLPANSKRPSPQRSGEACLLLGGRSGIGKQGRSPNVDYPSGSRFDSSGARHRAQQTRDFPQGRTGRGILLVLVGPRHGLRPQLTPLPEHALCPRRGVPAYRRMCSLVAAKSWACPAALLFLAGQGH